MKLKDSLNLPKTDFPMRASLPQNEPKRIEEWEGKSLYQKIQEKNKSTDKMFTMPDGPPYANGNIHLGHVLNKVLKDITLKYKNLNGFTAPFIPGWDGHGLPIELKVSKDLGSKRQGKSKKEIRELCRAEAYKWVGVQKEQFKRLGILADWENPYVTVDADYEAEEVRELARVYENGLIYKGKKPVYWCPTLQTALADTEVEHMEHESPSIFVKFKIKPETLPAALSKYSDLSAVIWTTTPWTLPANLGISVHPRFDYQVVETNHGTLLLAKDMIEKVCEETGLEVTLRGEKIKGSELENLVSDHPFLDKTSRFLLGEHVTLEAGTGLVHTAPGHGVDDYQVGLRYGLEVYSPVGPDGKYTSDYPERQGEHIFKANEPIVEELKESGALIFFKKFKHSYPHNWRSKTPLIYRATPQWFLKVDDENYSVRKEALALTESEIKFYPDWGKARLEGMLKNRPDWCLSRQRTWGVPIPVLICSSCGDTHTSSEFMMAVADKMEKSKEGMEAYFEGDLSDITPSKCASCDNTTFNKGQDILDVWFDSGVCHAAVQRKREGMKAQADIYLEGSDQHRGWFQTSLLSSLAAHKEPPFKALVTHGFVNDAKGRKMSKSVGNVIDPLKVIKNSGAEILRLWVTYVDYGQDMNISEEIFSRVTETYRRIRNTMRFMLGNLDGYEYKNLDPSGLNSLDRWALARLNQLVEDVTKAFETYNYYKAYHAINLFFTVDLSSRYLDILKDRLYVEGKNSDLRQSSQFVLYNILETTSVLMAPILSFLSEEVYGYLPASPVKEKKESVFLEDYPLVNEKFEDEDLIKEYELLFDLRSVVSKSLEGMRADKKIKGSLEARVTIPGALLSADMWSKYESQIAEFLIVSDVSYDEKGDKLDVGLAEGEKCPRCWHIEDLKEHKCGERICSRCSNVMDEIL
ncbi:MAG: isoleucine--tRNA ligase [Bdellovibrionales bacterium]